MRIGLRPDLGAGDFSGGVATKNGDVFRVVLVSQIIGWIVLIAAALALGESMPPPDRLAYGAAAGIAGVLGILFLYTGLAQGRMGIVAPVSAVVTALLPVLVALFTEGFPGRLKLAGFTTALIAVWWLSRQDRAQPARGGEWRLALCAGAGFGLFFILIERASPEAVLWPLVSARAASIVFMAAVVLHRRRSSSRCCAIRALPLVPVVMAGLLDTAGNVLFALAAQIGRLDIAAVVGSLYPATTVILARTVLKEPLHPHQVIGLGAALAAVVMISF